MSALRTLILLAAGFSTPWLLAGGCNPPTQAPIESPPVLSSPAASASAPAPVQIAAPSPPRPPPPVTTVPMAGEPAAVAMVEARLVASICENYQQLAKQQEQDRIKEMRAAVDDALRDWRQQQPGCWQRRRYPPPPTSGGLRLGGGGGPIMPGAAGGGGLSGIGASSGGSTGSAPPPRTADTARAAASASTTNDQVAGVDEADIVKTDGRFVYLGMNGALRIVEALRPQIVSVTKVPGSVRDIFVEGNRAVVYTASHDAPKPCTYGYDCQFAGDGTATTILVLDITDRASPKLARQIDLSGSLMAARRIGTAVHTVVADGDSGRADYQTWPSDLDTCGVSEATARAKFARLKRENEKQIRGQSFFPTMRDKGVERPLCNGLMRTAFSDGRSFTTVVSFDMTDDAAPATTATMQSRPGAVFASAQALYMSVVHRKRPSADRWYSFYPTIDEASEVHKFQIGACPSETRYLGSGVVPGHVLNQFAMDEWYGYLRIATTKGRVPHPDVQSSISVLAPSEGGNLVRVGAVDGIAPGEDIRSVRFDDDRGYIVTFKKTDPLFVIDLYDPAHPRILGELKIPGFSTYMHRIDPDHLLSIGFDADDEGSFAYFNGVILQLFDVRNPTDPRLLFKEKIGTRGSSSEAATDHLAFNFFAQRGLLAIPMTICEGGGNGSFGNQLTFSGLLVYDVSLSEGFTRLGGIDHGTRGANCSTWWSNANSVVNRSVFLDDLVYSIATDRLKVQRMGRFGQDVADIALMP